MPSPLRIALAQFPLQPHKSFRAWRENIAAWVREAAAGKAQLVVFPEYAATDLGAISGKRHMTADDLIADIQSYFSDYISTFQDLAKTHGLYIVTGTFPQQDGDAFFNRSYFIGPKDTPSYQDKLILTRFEREKTTVSAGEKVTLFNTEFGLMAIAICYDIQFPLLAHKLAKAGCRLIIVPSCTGSVAGNNRVKIACHARALENQIAVVQSPTVGDARWQPIADTNAGIACAFAPPDYGFPETGIVAQGVANQPGWTYADLDFSAYENLRRNGHVLNWQCWDEQEKILNLPITRTEL